MEIFVDPYPIPPRGLERAWELGFQEFTQLGCRLELWDWVQFLERRSECVRETPDGSPPEFLILRFEVQVMYSSSKVLRRFELTLHKCLVDNHLGGDVGEFAFLPRFHLLAHGLEVALHAIDTDRNAID